MLLGIAAFKGAAQVQVTLRDDDGVVLGSRIVRTNVLPKESRQRIERIRQLLRVSVDSLNSMYLLNELILLGEQALCLWRGFTSQ